MTRSTDEIEAPRGHTDERALVAVIRRGLYCRVTKLSKSAGRAHRTPAGTLTRRPPTWRGPGHTRGRLQYDERPEALERDADGAIVVSSYGDSQAERLRTADELEALAAARRANAVVSGRAIGELAHDVGPAGHRRILELVKAEIFDSHQPGPIPVSLVAQVPPVVEKQAALERAQARSRKGPDPRRVAGDPRNYHVQAVWSPVDHTGRYLGDVTGPDFVDRLKSALARATNQVLEEKGIDRRVTVEGGARGTVHLGTKAALAARLPPRPDREDPSPSELRAPAANTAIARGAAPGTTWSHAVQRLTPELRAARKRRYAQERTTAMLASTTAWLERIKAVPAEQAIRLDESRARAYTAIERQRQQIAALHSELATTQSLRAARMPTDKQRATLEADARRRGIDLDELAPGWRADAGAGFAAIRAFDRGRAAARQNPILSAPAPASGPAAAPEPPLPTDVDRLRLATTNNDAAFRATLQQMTLPALTRLVAAGFEQVVADQRAVVKTAPQQASEAALWRGLMLAIEVKNQRAEERAPRPPQRPRDRGDHGR